jgi:uncharacterized protein
VGPGGHSEGPSSESVERVLGGEWLAGDRGSCMVVSRRIDPHAAYGNATIGQLADLCRACGDEAPLISGGPVLRPPYVFFDLETSGLSGGAGTYAFLVGCGRFDEDGAFVTRQYILTGFATEPALLFAVSLELARAGGLISFNGKSFDAPVLETRFLLHRLDWIGSSLPHLDVLHPARRFWGPGSQRCARLAPAPDRGGSAVFESTPCSLIALERAVLGAGRGADVPGFEIPARFFQFMRTGDPRPILGVLEHNRRDLLALAALTARLLHLVRTGATAAKRAREALALGRLYGGAGLEARAREAYLRALAMSDPDEPRDDLSRFAPAESPDQLRIEALRGLALLSRRSRRFDEAAGYWSQLLEHGACPPHIARKAAEALAIHHEHRARDLPRARHFALNSLSLGDLEGGIHGGWREAAQHRIARLDTKLERGRTLRW